MSSGKNMALSVDEFIKKLQSSGKLHDGFIFSKEQRALVEKSFAEGQTKIKKNTLDNVPYSVIKNKDGVPYVIFNFVKEMSCDIQGAQARLKIAQNLRTGEFCLVKIARIKDFKTQQYKKDEAERETLALKNYPTMFRGHQFRDNPSQSHEYKHYNFIRVLPGLHLRRSGLLSESPITQCEVALKLFKSLQEFHRTGFIHRDVHGENVIIDPKTMELNIIDFGLAVPINEEGKYWRGPNVSDTEGTGPQMRFANGTDFHSIACTIFFKDEVLKEIIHALENQSAVLDRKGYVVEYNYVDIKPTIVAIEKYYKSLKKSQEPPSSHSCTVS